MQYSTNYNMQKPDNTDFYSITHMNNNTDITDAQLKTINNALTEMQSNITTEHITTTGNVTLSNGANTANISFDGNEIISSSPIKATGIRVAPIFMSASGTVPASSIGGLIEYNGAANGTLTLPNPTVYKGATFIFWNNTGYTMTLASPVNNIMNSEAALSSTSMVFAGGAIVKLTNDGYNWLVTFDMRGIKLLSNGNSLIGLDTSGNRKNLIWITNDNNIRVGNDSIPLNLHGARLTINNTDILMPNSRVLWSKDTSGNDRSVFWLDNTNRLCFGDVAQDLPITLFGSQVFLSTDSGEFYTQSIYPDNDGNRQLGNSVRRWANVYCTGGIVQTSDKNKKKNIVSLLEDERYFTLFKKLIPVSYQFTDGTSGRTHVGFIAQDVESIMLEIGLTNLDFAGFCKDEVYPQKDNPYYKKSYDELIELGLTEEEALKADIYGVTVDDTSKEKIYVYALRYDEFISLNVAYTQRLEKRLESVTDSIINATDFDDLKAKVEKLINA